mmetsp:Transcript_21732/g.35880  ORF Transcript_21732/g.35880 Transcript_21732/m.35880 type:complete len:89 (-) Transcript_21732:31-297(-)
MENVAIIIRGYTADTGTTLKLEGDTLSGRLSNALPAASLMAIKTLSSIPSSLLPFDYTITITSGQLLSAISVKRLTCEDSIHFESSVG